MTDPGYEEYLYEQNQAWEDEQAHLASESAAAEAEANQVTDLPSIHIPQDSNFLTCDTKVALKASAEANADEMVAYKGWAQTIAEVAKAQVYLEYMEKWIRQNINIEEQISKNGVVAAGIQIDRTNLQRKFDFSVCGDPEWEILSNALRTVKEQLKDKEDFLKKLNAPMAITEGKYAGTEIKPPHVTGGGSNYKCTFLKDVKENNK